MQSRDEPLPEIPRKRPKSLRSLILLAVANLFLLIVIIFGVYWGMEGSRLRAAISRLRAQGMPCNESEMDHFYRISPSAIDATPAWLLALDSLRKADLPRRGKDLPLIGNNDLSIPDFDRPWPEMGAARTLLHELEPQLQLIRKAADLGGEVRFPVIFSSMGPPSFADTQELRPVVRLLRLDANVAARDHDFERVFHDVQMIFEIVLILKNEPEMIPQIVRFAIQAIAVQLLQELLPHCHWSDDQLLKIQQSIIAPDFREGMTHALYGERAMSISMLDQIPMGGFNIFGKQELLRCYEQGLNSFAKPWPEPLLQAPDTTNGQTAGTLSLSARLGSLGKSLVEPNFEQAARVTARAVARQRCALIGVVMYREQMRTNRLPASLEDIQSQLPVVEGNRQQWLNDPWDHGRLRLKQSRGSLVIYSVGEDQQDNGGEIGSADCQSPRDIGFAIPILQPAAAEAQSAN